MRRANPSQQFFAAPALVLAISVFMIFVQLANLDTDNEAVIYGVMLILQILVFAVPTGFFCYLRGKKRSSFLGKIKKELNLRKRRLNLQKPIPFRH